ncbi:DEAD-box ATP-dependent RNA helicase 5 [Zea mays]|uniref:DEAD-box ATP-dependent RNA helicase 5 n=1 Tax=Zea mays TaxID=4577 RepID=A0A1D6HXI0_MAIZE|nr:DEAD-box ATP-dependent RNA helicase 5 [Zea mays]
MDVIRSAICKLIAATDEYCGSGQSQNIALLL